MLAMSHTSIIPMILIGLKQKNTSQHYKMSKELEKSISVLNCNAGNIEMLHDSLIYGHVENGSNHFEYYFETERLMKRICEQNYNEFLLWMNSLKKIIQIQNRQIKCDSNYEIYIYDILVAPMNRTNASFVEYINTWAFESVPIIVYIDANREFRDNIKTKYSNLSTLYNNLVISGKKAVINFHYIDDCIISGTTFYRTRSLLKSLFPENAFEETNNVYVNVFQNVILLLNRCSHSTKLNYAMLGHFFSYIDVHISSMRTHHDKACVLCENVNNYKMLRDYSSTNAMAEEWNRKLNKHFVKSIENAREVYSDNESMRERHFKRLYCANRFSDQLDLIKEKKNSSEEVKKLIVSLIEQKIVESEEIDVLQNNIEWIISYLKVIARPFLVFRKSTLEAVFGLLIELMENWGRVSEDNNSIYATIATSLKIVSGEKCTVEFLECVEGLYRSIISLLSSLGAKYLIRKGSYDKLIKNDPLLLRTKKEREFKMPKLNVAFREEFELFYAANIKRMIILNKDESVGLWFEHLLVYGYENDQIDSLDEEFIQKYGIRSDFGRRLFLENTYIIFQTVSSVFDKCKKYFLVEEGGIEKKIEIIKEEISDFETAYYYENYRNLYNSENDLGILQELKEEIQYMVLLYGHLEGYIENEKNVIDYYNTLADFMHKVVKADGVLLLGCSSFEGKNDIYKIASHSQHTSTRIEFEDIIYNINDWENNKKILKDRQILIVLEEKNCVAIRIDSNRERKSDTDHDISDVIYCVFEFNELKGMKDYELLRRVRNVLVFRHTFVQRFRNDFYNNAFKVLTDQRHQNELLISRKAVTHTSNSTLYYVVEEMKNEKNTNLVYAAYALQLAADSMISQLYVDMIKKTKNEFLCSTSLEFKISDRMVNIFSQLRFYSDSDQIFEGKYTGLLIENKVTEVLDWNIDPDEQHYIQLIMVAILHNAAAHGFADENRKVHVKIYQEIMDSITYLCFENETRYPCNEDYSSEEGQGITVLALKHYFKKNFGREVIAQLFSEHEKVMFVIKLPIYKEKKCDEKDKGVSN